jgi:transposase
MAKQLVSDELWSVVQPLLPPKPAHPKGGHPFTVPDRAALTGIIFVLETGIPWESLPPEMGCGSGMTCWRRLRDWRRAGVWTGLHRVLLQRLAAADRIDWSRASADGARVPAKKGARAPDRIRSTAASRGRTITWWATAAASRWRPSPRRRT